MQMEKATLWDIVKSVSTVVVIAIFSVKLFLIPTSLVIDFPMLLSLLLALFSVALSALFYFKATDSSNQFYDNTHKFTRDISQLLAKMESGFGERLRNLDEGYTSMRSYLQSGPKGGEDKGDIIEKVQETKQKLEEENKEFKKIVDQRNKIIDDLIESTQLDKVEKEKIIDELKGKEEELSSMQSEIKRLNSKLTLARFQKRQGNTESERPTGFDSFSKRHVVRKIGADRIGRLTAKALKKEFEEHAKVLPDGFFQDLRKYGLFEGHELTNEGVSYFRNLAAEILEDE